jgi:meiotically up-regulated gene 157 (Mug157) protein
MFAAVALCQIEEIARDVFHDLDLSAFASELREQIKYGIETYGKFLHPLFGTIYAYETDGFGNFQLMDDANVPSLLSIPYLGYVDTSDVVYQNTRAFVLSGSNPYYFEGRAAKGIGSPHTPKGYVWPIGLMVQGLTSNDTQEIKTLMDTLLRTDAETGLMHEGFHCDCPEEFTRPWFAWANSLFGEFAQYYVAHVEGERKEHDIALRRKHALEAGSGGE